VGKLKGQLATGGDPDGVLRWRIDRLRQAGCSAQLAERLGRDCSHDLHELLELIDRGCPAEVAARILAPLEDESVLC
jgi:hypothetical protein